MQTYRSVTELFLKTAFLASNNFNLASCLGRVNKNVSILTLFNRGIERLRAFVW